jgi:hypothetical protein
MNHPAAEVQCIPAAQRQRHTTASSSQGLIEIQPETAKAPCTGLQNQMLSILRSKAPCKIPGGRMKAKS